MKPRIIRLRLLLLILFLFYCGCTTSAPDRERPKWIDGPTRTVDNGYIVYIGTGEEIADSQAQLAAEGLAIQDLANECSFIPKGTRVEDRYSEKLNNTYKAYAKIAIEVSACDEAAKITDPNEVKSMASQPFTEELQRFEDSIQGHSDEVVDADVPEKQLTRPEGAQFSSEDHYYMARQYIVYQNQAVILAAPGYYAPGTPAYVNYTTHVRPVIMGVQSYSAQNPQVRNNPRTWSTMASQLRVTRPQSFNPNSRPYGNRSLRPPQSPSTNRGHWGRSPSPRPRPPTGGRGYGRRRGRGSNGDGNP